MLLGVTGLDPGQGNSSTESKPSTWRAGEKASWCQWWGCRWAMSDGKNLSGGSSWEKKCREKRRQETGQGRRLCRLEKTEGEGRSLTLTDRSSTTCRGLHICSCYLWLQNELQDLEQAHCFSLTVLWVGWTQLSGSLAVGGAGCDCKHLDAPLLLGVHGGPLMWPRLTLAVGWQLSPGYSRQGLSFPLCGISIGVPSSKKKCSKYTKVETADLMKSSLRNYSATSALFYRLT